MSNYPLISLALIHFTPPDADHLPIIIIIIIFYLFTDHLLLFSKGPFLEFVCRPTGKGAKKYAIWFSS